MVHGPTAVSKAATPFINYIVACVYLFVNNLKREIML